MAPRLSRASSFYQNLCYYYIMQVEINEKLKERVAKLAEKYGLRLVLLFGSQAKREARKDSDIDIAILAPRRLLEQDMIYLNYEFTNIFPIDKIDLVDLHGAPPLLMKQISDSTEIIYSMNSYDFINFQIYAARLYAEAQPLFDLRRKRISSIIQNINLRG